MSNFNFLTILRTIREVALPFIVRWYMLIALVKTKVIKLDPHKPEIARIREAAVLSMGCTHCISH